MSGFTRPCHVCAANVDYADMWHCSCLQLHFCSEACSVENPHRLVTDEYHTDELHSDAEIEAMNPFTKIRILRRGNFIKAVQQLVDTYIQTTNAILGEYEQERQAEEAGSAYQRKEHRMNSAWIDTFVTGFSKGRRDDARRELTQFGNRVHEMIHDLDRVKARSIIVNGSNELLTLFKKEGHYIRQSRKDAVDEAWLLFIDMLVGYRFNPDSQAARRSLEEYEGPLGRILAGVKEDVPEHLT